MSKLTSKIASVEKSQKELRDYLLKKVSLIKQNQEIKSIGSNKCFTVSLSTLSENDLILDPSYYNFETQKESVKKHINKDFDCGINYLNKILKTGKDNYSGLKYHPKFLEEIQKIIND